MSESDRIKRLLAACSAEDKQELLRAVNWRAKAFEREKEKPTRAATADHNAARDNLDATVTRLSGVYFPD